MKTLLLAFGHRYRQDDSIAPHLIDQINSEKVDCIDGRTDALAQFDTILKYQRVLIIDAVLMGEKAGESAFFSPENVHLKIKNDATSTHGFGLAELLSLLLKFEAKTEISIYGIEPLKTDLGDKLSAPLKEKTPFYLQQINDWITKE